ncbi:hypothetical protein [Nocardia otitidiscaviarum]|uniref:hypothetical protein n=1 Tax=Nocardia otitidiscaviarum TaxID=1823 RepID=UPI002B4AEE1A|nr:hypothetical protein [Nocardia otitidiscaviarum]
MTDEHPGGPPNPADDDRPVALPTPPRGSMQRQEPGVTQPRPPTVAEARAREKARRRAEEQARAAADAEAAKPKKRKKLLIGGVAVVGVAGLVGGGYLAYSALTGPDITAYCTVIVDKGETVVVGNNGETYTATRNNEEIVVPDRYCEEASRSSGGNSTGVFILAGNQYRYYYGGTNTIGKEPSGGTTVKPKGAEIKTKSGTTIQRGGLGTRIGGGS